MPWWMWFRLDASWHLQLLYKRMHQGRIPTTLSTVALAVPRMPDGQGQRHHVHPIIPDFLFESHHIPLVVFILFPYWTVSAKHETEAPPKVWPFGSETNVVFLNPVSKWEAFPFGGAFSRMGWSVIGDHRNHILGLQNHGPEDLWKIEIWGNKFVRNLSYWNSWKSQYHVHKRKDESFQNDMS